MSLSWLDNGTILIKVGAHHLAFLRGYLEGLDLATLARRYLETATSPDPELRVARTTLKWIRAQLLIVARRRGHFPEARLILIDPDKLRDVTVRVIPSLEEFREQRDPHELYSEAELIEIFQEEYGQPAGNERRVRRNERLRRRQLLALNTLEKMIGAPPALDDEVSGWLHPILAKRLQAANIHTLNDLRQIIAGRGYRWWTRVPRFGEKAAAQVLAWLGNEAVERSLGGSLDQRARTKASILRQRAQEVARPKSFGILPLEYLQPPPALDGSQGCNRGANSRIDAEDDLGAIGSWLARHDAKTASWRTNRKEAERFLLWSLVKRGKPLSSLDRDDCLAYRVFLESVGGERFAAEETAMWCAPRGTPRWSPFWRPFEGKLSASSINLSLTVAGSLCRWLAANGYLRANPWQSAKVRIRGEAVASARECFGVRHWKILQAFIDHSAPGLATERLRLLTHLIWHGHMRLGEVRLVSIGDLEKLVSGVTVTRWEKLDRSDRAALASAASRYLAVLQEQKVDLAKSNPALHALNATRGGGVASTGTRPLTPHAIYLLLCSLFRNCASLSGLSGEHTHALHGLFGAEVTQDLLAEIAKAQPRYLLRS
ncbi:Phage integrase protein [Noviherbaspirillum humi]|uniref:Phage integrase protein n=1 Tax=Noviherbaspirillum humi TaxID=1688639 RepID=A0A239M4Z5_9BURK|nr:phage integrase family protein [Noviherbaspirillum humi]SNT37074.1 Phage integrase protein [Noviherbaspirillum humi]